MYIYIYGCTRSRDSSVGIATGSALDRRGVWTLIPSRGKIFLLSTSSRSVLCPTHPPIQWVPGALLSRVKRSVTTTSNWCRSQEYVDLYLHFHIHLNGVMLN
jgi:hypothetical protein